MPGAQSGKGVYGAQGWVTEYVEFHGHSVVVSEESAARLETVRGGDTDGFGDDCE